MPVHGTESNRRIEVIKGDYYPMFEGSTVTKQLEYRVTVSDRWCNSCYGWIECKGIADLFSCPECRTSWKGARH